MPDWALLALIAAAGITLVAVIALRHLWDKQAGSAEYRADTAEKTSAIVQKQAAIVATKQDREDVAKSLEKGDF